MVVCGWGCCCYCSGGGRAPLGSAPTSTNNGGRGSCSRSCCCSTPPHTHPRGCAGDAARAAIQVILAGGWGINVPVRIEVWVGVGRVKWVQLSVRARERGRSGVRNTPPQRTNGGSHRQPAQRPCTFLRGPPPVGGPVIRVGTCPAMSYGPSHWSPWGVSRSPPLPLKSCSG